MNREQLNEALKNYLDGTASPEEKAVIDQWYEQYGHMPGFTETLSDEERKGMQRRLLAGITHKITPVEQQQVAELPATGKYRRLTRWVAAAAVLAALVLTTLLWNRSGSSKTHMNLVANQTGHILKQVLSDGSVVWLNPGATLRYPDTFAIATRTVTMSGDCFFEVTKNPQRPFIIESDKLVTKVWGTSFRVWDKNDGSVAKVTVVTGKVSVSKKGSEGAASTNAIARDEVVLLPKQEVVFDKNTQQLKTAVDPDMKPVQKWSHTGMVIEDEAFADIAAALQEKFGVTILLADSRLGQQRMTADLSNLNLAEVLEVLKVSMQIQYTIHDDSVTLSR
ncbi:FecR family protein [Filimonas lacunae]|uniref:FecR family protein n=1 Tax=Filimonas lacunae TaxID=477680 RepID=A0A173MH53_9BACT|nr:FecR domain-containing protein [Filimonas lacunae]BAV06748.1 anti-sigma factor [Filimonas lacunae]SIT34419.1 FecR family protein [Filimonas lacunae]